MAFQRQEKILNSFQRDKFIKEREEDSRLENDLHIQLPEQGSSINNIVVYNALSDLYSRYYAIEHKYAGKLRYEYSDINRRFIPPESLPAFDLEKRHILDQRRELILSYVNELKKLFDYAVGTDFSDRDLNIFNFLKFIDISEINFIGLSIQGKPISRQMLRNADLQGAEYALVTKKDLKRLQDKDRRLALTSRIKCLCKKQGKLLSPEYTHCTDSQSILNAIEKSEIDELSKLVKPEHVINLVPLWRAADIGDIKAVKTRLDAGVDPNESPYGNIEECPILLAAKKNHVKIVKLLAEHPAIDKKLLARAIRVIVTPENILSLVPYLISLLDDENASEVERYIAIHCRHEYYLAKIFKEAEEANGSNNNNSNAIADSFIYAKRYDELCSLETNAIIKQQKLKNELDKLVANAALARKDKSQNNFIAEPIITFPEKDCLKEKLRELAQDIEHAKSEGTFNINVINMLTHIHNTMVHELSSDINLDFKDSSPLDIISILSTHIKKQLNTQKLKEASNITKRELEGIQQQQQVESATDLAENIEQFVMNKPLISKPLKSAMYGLIGALVGFVVGIVIGAAFTCLNGGLAAFPGAILGSITGFTGGTALGLGTGTAGMIAASFGIFRKSKITAENVDNVTQPKFFDNR